MSHGDGVGRDRIREARAKLAKTQFHSALELRPMANVSGDLAGIVGDYLLDLMGMFHERTVCRRVNVAVTELVTNALSNTLDPDAALRVDVRVDAEALVIEVSNEVDESQYAAVEARVQQISQSADVKALLRDTIHFRRPRRLAGGLGLLRLASENRFVLSVRRDGNTMTVRATHALEVK